MEVVLLAGIGASSMLCALLLMGAGGGEGSEAAARRLARRVLRRCRAALRLAGRSRAVARLVSRESWAGCAARAVEAAAAAGVELDECEACAAVIGLATSAGLVASALFATWLCVPLSLAALFAGVPAWSARKKEAARKQAVADMPAVFRALSVAMGTGMTLVQAAEYAGAHVGGVVGDALARLSLRLRCGMATPQALDELQAELEAPGVGLLSTALEISHRTGSPLKDLFQRSARLVERQGEFERLLAVKTAQVRLSVKVVCSLPAIMVALLVAISPDYQAGLATVAGTACVCVAVALDALAILIIRRLVSGVLG